VPVLALQGVHLVAPRANIHHPIRHRGRGRHIAAGGVVLRVASEWGEMGTVPKIKMFPGERHRERVVSPDEEGRYLAAAREPLASIGAVLVDSGLRPEECYRLVW
jgi:hypothetical protein